MRPLVLVLLFSTSSLWASGEIIERAWYTLSYNEEHEVADWVSYTLERGQLKNCAPRARSFRIDPLITTGSATPADYKGSGYDRGHLVPAGDMKFDKGAMSDTFYLSNVTPQPALFNQGRWSQLENLVRAWAKKYGKLWVVTGPVLRSGLSSVGKQNQISVPEEYFKLLLRKEKAGYKGIAFLMATHVPYPELRAYALSIDEVEELSGGDFFTFLGTEETAVESELSLRDWDFEARFEYLPCAASVAP